MEDNKIMMNSEVNGAAADQAGHEDPRDIKKYSDNDLDEIIRKKIARERARYEKRLSKNNPDPEDDISKRELDLDIRERKLRARENLSEVDLPESYLNLLDYSSEDSFVKSTEAVTAFVDDLMDMLAEKRATGTTPKSFSSNKGAPDHVREVFGL